MKKISLMAAVLSVAVLAACGKNPEYQPVQQVRTEVVYVDSQTGQRVQPPVSQPVAQPQVVYQQAPGQPVQSGQPKEEGYSTGALVGTAIAGAAVGALLNNQMNKNTGNTTVVSAPTYKQNNVTQVPVTTPKPALTTPAYPSRAATFTQNNRSSYTPSAPSVTRSSTSSSTSRSSSFSSSRSSSRR